MKVIHRDNGYSTCVEYSDGAYKIWFNGLKINKIFVFSSKREKNIEVIVKNYIEMTNMLGLARKNGWTPRFSRENLSIEFYDYDGDIERSNHSKPIIQVTIGKRLTNRKWEKVKPFFPVVGPVGFDSKDNVMLQNILLAAEEARREVLQSYLLQNPDIETEEFIETMDRLNDPEKDIQEILC